MIDFNDAPDSSPKPKPFFKVMPEARTPRVVTPGQEPRYLQGLNAPQRAAVESTEGPLIVLAGAGSGKTKMLTSRISYLMDVRGVSPHHILAMTFTNKAAREMLERVRKQLEDSNFLSFPEIGTFHSVCIRLLRREIQATPFTKPFVIYDDSDQLSLIKRTLEKLGIDEKAYSPKGMQAMINSLKCDAIEPHEFEAEPHDLYERQLKRVYEQYQKDLFTNNALDFGEIICMAYRVLRDQPMIRAKYQNLYRYIHVDEYQDTNRAQYLLLLQLAHPQHGGHSNICVVGDEDQSIYKWRGADIKNILDFEKDYPGATVVKLEQNYRSTQNIITAASQVIRNNKERKDKTLWTENSTGTFLQRIALADERAEAEFVVSEIKRLATNEGYALPEFAVFYRTHAQSRQFEEVFRREKVAYEIVGGLRFYDRKEIKDILSYFKVMMNPQDSVSLKRIINVPGRGIGKTTIDKLEAIQLELEQGRAKAQSQQMEWGESQTTDTSLWAALQMAARDSSLMSSATSKKLANFVQFIEKLMVLRPTKLISEMYHLILDETGYVRELREEGTDEASARVENLEEFDNVLQEFEENWQQSRTAQEIEEQKKDLLPTFLEESALSTDVEVKDTIENRLRSVHMMSLHASKGLEYPVVFLVGMEEGLFPSGRVAEDPQELEEERRLCYVGITRAREHLYLTHAGVRRIWGEVHAQEPARFFQEIPDELMEFKDLTYGMGMNTYRTGSSRQFQRNQYSEHKTESTPSVFQSATPKKSEWIGKDIDHPDYGRGQIIAQEGSGKDEKVTVRFKSGAPKKFLFRFVQGFLD